MTDAKHRAQEAAGEAWEPTEAMIAMFRDKPSPPLSERDAIAAWMRGACQQGVFELMGEYGRGSRDAMISAANAIERGDYLKGDVA